MSDLESLRDIAKRLVEDYRIKRAIAPRDFPEPPAEVRAAMAVMFELSLCGIDRNFLEQCGIES